MLVILIQLRENISRNYTFLAKALHTPVTKILTSDFFFEKSKFLFSRSSSSHYIVNAMSEKTIFNRQFRIHRFDNYVILRGSLALMNRKPITLRNY